LFCFLVAAPYWRQDRPPQDATASEDENVEFECTADGIPPPTVSWSFNARPYSGNGTRLCLVLFCLFIIRSFLCGYAQVQRTWKWKWRKYSLYFRIVL